MSAVLPWLFACLAGLALVASMLGFWQSLRSAFGAAGDDAGADLATSEQRATLLDEKHALLRSIKDLEFERDVGKISKEDYERLDVKMRARAREVLRLLDEDVEPYREKAEGLVAERLKKVDGATPYRSAAPDAAAPEQDQEEAPQREAEARTEAEPDAAAAGEAPEPSEPEATAEAQRVACPSCETDNEPDATFCKKCGTRISQDAEAGDGEDDEADGEEGES